jgi:hypothetical protein
MEAVLLAVAIAAGIVGLGTIVVFLFTRDPGE